MVTVNVSLEQIPLFIREGSVIPMRKYAPSIEAGNNDTLYLHVYPGAQGTFTLIEDDGSFNDYLKGGYAKTIITLNSDNLPYIRLMAVSTEGNQQDTGRCMFAGNLKIIRKRIIPDHGFIHFAPENLPAWAGTASVLYSKTVLSDLRRHKRI
jgi:hypothetical protein